MYPFPARLTNIVGPMFVCHVENLEYTLKHNTSQNKNAIKSNQSCKRIFAYCNKYDNVNIFKINSIENQSSFLSND